MKFTPKPYKQLMTDLLLEKGEGTFEITGWIEKESKETKRPMLEIQLKVTDSKKRTGPLKYFIMLDDDKDQVLNKLYKLCYAANKGYIYDDGNFDDRVIGGKGRLVIGVTVDKNGNDQNNVMFFILPKAGETHAKSLVQTNKEEPPPFEDDDIDIPI